ncbi:hypothetical protein [Brevundimonas naejangsanensis]|uniref:hypothetical protein n=1 Tax=Brevundimonas naejangsanensis TaxID=588932 RepID=UPI001F23BD26|nr:hypothetical protein [Brevundimonas naejangsanensis]
MAVAATVLPKSVLSIVVMSIAAGGKRMWSRRSILLGAAGAGVARATPVWPQEALSNDELLFSEGRYLPTYLDLKAQSEAGDEAAR